MSRTRLITFTVKNTGSGAVNVQFGVDDERFSTPEQIELLQPGESVQRSSTFTMPDNATAPSDFACTLTSTATDLASFETIQDQTQLVVNVRASTISVTNVAFGTKDVLVNVGANTANVTFTNSTKFPTTISNVARSSGSTLFTAGASGVTIPPYSSATIPIVLTLANTTPIGSVSATFGFSFTRDGATKTSSFTASAVLVEDSAVVTATSPVALGSADQNHTGDLTAGITFTSTSKQRSVDILSVEYVSGTNIVTIDDADFTLAAEGTVQKTLTGKTGLSAGAKSGVYRYTYQFAGAAGTKTGTFTATMTVTQVYQISIDPDHAGTVEVPVANTAGYVDVVVTSSTGWTVSSANGFLSFNKTSGANGDTVRISWTQNTGVERSGSATFTCGTSTATFTFEQAMVTSSFNIPDVNVNLPENGATTTATVAVSLVEGVDIGQYDSATWSVLSKPAWVSSASISGTGKSVTLQYTYSTNTDLQNTRSGTISVQAVGEDTLTGSVNLTQAAASPTLTLSLSSWAPVVGGATTSTTVTSNTSWSAASNATNWLTIDTASGTGNGSIGLTATENTGTQRTGTITVQTTSGSPQVIRTISVTQAAASDAINIVQTTVTLDGPQSGLTGSLTINGVVPAGASWTIEKDANATWLTLDASSGSGNGSVGYSANSENTTGSSRSATITATRGEATDTCTITQPAYSLVLGNDLTFDADGSTQNLSWSANGPWTASITGTGFTWSDDTTTDKTGTAGSGNFSVKAPLYAGTTSRTGSVTIKTAGAVTKDTATLTQTAASSTFSPGSLTFATGGEVKSTGLTIVGDVTGTLSISGTGYSLVDSGGNPHDYGSITNDVTVYVKATANGGSGTNSGTLTFTPAAGSAQQVSLSQGALTISPTSWEFAANSPANKGFGITVDSSTSWTSAITTNLTGNALSVVSGSSGTGNGTTTVGCTTNTGAAKTGGVLTVTFGGITKTVSITQAAAVDDLTLSPATSSPTADAQDIGLTISNISPVGTTCTASSDQAWAPLSKTTGITNEQITVNLQANGTASSRVATITVTRGTTSKTCVITQQVGSVSVNPTSASFDSDGQDKDVAVTANGAWTAALSGDAAYSIVSGSSGSGNGTITLRATANTSGSTRTGTLTVTRVTNRTATTSLTQAAITFDVSPLSWTNISAAGATKSDFTVTTNVANATSLEVKSKSAWVSSASIDKSTVSVTVDANTGAARDGSVVVGVVGTTSFNKTISLSQLAGGATVYWDPSNTTSLTVAMEGGLGAGMVSSTGLSGAWSMASDSQWAYVTQDSGTGNLNAVQINTDQNFGAERVATITVTSGGTNYQLTLTQSGVAVADPPSQGTLSAPSPLSYTMAPEGPVNITFARGEILSNGDIKYRYRNLGLNIFVYYLNGNWYNTNDDTPCTATITGGTPSGAPTPLFYCSAPYGEIHMTDFYPADQYSGPYYDFYDGPMMTSFTYDTRYCAWNYSPEPMTVGHC